MANPIAVDHWQGTGVRLNDVSSALADLRHRSRDVTSPRTAVMTFVAVAGDQDRASTASSVLRLLSSHHPARLLILHPDADAAASLDGQAALFTVDSGGHEINFEEIRLDVHGQAAKHLDSVADAFTISDLPIAAWYVGTIPDINDPLLNIATAVLVDSRDAADSGRLHGLLELARERRVVDLSWMRLKPYRRLTAAVFSETSTRPWLEGIGRVKVWGKAGPRHMLGGWMVAQLGLSPRQVELHDDRHVRLEIECSLDGEAASFTVARGPGRTLEARANLPDRACAPHHARLPDDPMGAALADALLHLEADVVWQSALSVAARLDG